MQAADVRQVAVPLGEVGEVQIAAVELAPVRIGDKAVASAAPAQVVGPRPRPSP